MAVRHIGDVRIVVVYDPDYRDDEDRARYECRLRTEPRDGSLLRAYWRCAINSPPGGPLSADLKTRLAVDSPEAYDQIAETALTFATASSDDSDGPCPELACEFEEASRSAWCGNKLLVRRSK